MASEHWQLWMECEPYMTENFIIAAFRKMGEDPTTVRLMRNKYTGEPAGYCFVNFATDEKAMDSMHKLNGKPIPGTNPIVRFRLNSVAQVYEQCCSKYPEFKEAKLFLDKLNREALDSDRN